MSLADRLLFAPLSTLSARGRAVATALCTLLTLAWSAPASRLRYTWTLPDVKFYLLMAQGRYDQVPAPFSARPLAPLAAHWIAALLHGSAETGFVVLAVGSLVCALLAVFSLATRSGAPRWTLLVLALVPFWPQLLGEAGLPDPFYTALLAAFLLALEREWMTLAAALLFPLMLTRESTSLTLVCFLLTCWRQMRWPQAVLALGSAAAGMLLVRHLSAGSLPNPEHLSGGLYMAGKLVANTARNLGVMPWSNVYREVCAVPVWQHAVHLGPVRSVGVCRFSADGPRELCATVLTVFGALPVAGIALWASRQRPAEPVSAMTRFALVYGGVSVLLAPMLGTWLERLVGYGWPLFLVAVPRVLGMRGALQQWSQGAGWRNPAWAWIPVLALVILAFSPSPVPVGALLLLAVLEGSWAALFLVQLRRCPEAGFRL